MKGKPRPPKRVEYLMTCSIRRPPDFSYGAFVSNSPDDFDKLLAADEEKLSSLASCLANPTRVKIVKALFDGEKTSSELSTATGLPGNRDDELDD